MFSFISGTVMNIPVAPRLPHGYNIFHEQLPLAKQSKLIPSDKLFQTTPNKVSIKKKL